MKFDDKHAFNKPAAVVRKMYSDQAFFERKYKDSGAWDIKVLECKKTDTSFSIKCSRTVKNDVLPDIAKKFMGENSVIIQQDTWDLVKMTGRLEVEIKGAPVKITADMTLKDEGSGSANVMKWNVSCGIPLIGGKLEQIVGGDIQMRSKEDAAISAKILLDY